MEKYLRDTFADFINQDFGTDGQKLFDEDEEFWEMVAQEYYPDADFDESWQKTVKDQVIAKYKIIDVKLNGKQIGYIYILPSMNTVTISEYALNQCDMSYDHMNEQGNLQINVKIDSVYPWPGKDKSYVSINFGEKVVKTPKVAAEKKLTRPNLSEEKWKAKYLKDFGETSAEGWTWADLYEMQKVAAKPKKEWVPGAMVDALLQGKEGGEEKHYGYITKIGYNTKGRPIALTIKTFEDQVTEWVWNGTPSKGSWLEKKEFTTLRSSPERKTIKTLKYKGLELSKKKLVLNF